MHRPTREEFHALAAEHTVVPVWRELLADLVTPVAAYQRLGRSYCKHGNAQAAIKMLQRAWVLNPRDRETCFLLGKSYLDLGQVNEAQDQFILMAQEHPEWADARLPTSSS